MSQIMQTLGDAASRESSRGSDEVVNVSQHLETYKQISAILPDDEPLLHELIHGLKDELGILAFDHHSCRGIGALGKRSAGRRFRAPPAKALRMLSVLVAPDRAEEVFEYI